MTSHIDRWRHGARSAGAAAALSLLGLILLFGGEARAAEEPALEAEEARDAGESSEELLSEAPIESPPLEREVLTGGGLQFTAGVFGVIVPGREWDLVSEDDVVPEFLFSVGYLLDRAGGWKVGLSVEGHGAGVVSAPLFQEDKVGLGLTELLGQVAYYRPLTSNLWSYAELSAGWSWATLGFNEQGSLTQDVDGFSGKAMVGIDLLLGDWKREAALVMGFAAGYAYRPTYRFDSVGGVDWGSFDASAPCFRWTLGLWF